MKKINQELVNNLVGAARKGEISRRSFMQYSVAAGLTVSAATSLWSSSARAEPKRGGTFRIAQHDGNTTD